MTAPLDIGLEQNDAILGAGHDEVFDLEETEKRMDEKTQVHWLNDDVPESIDNDNEYDEASDAAEADEGTFSQDEDQDMRYRGLEAELDGLYDAYKHRLWERDAKSRAKEQRLKNKEEEWVGIQPEHGSDEESSESEGGWGMAQRNKLQTSDTSSDESSDDEGGVETIPSRKRSRSLKNPTAPPPKRQRLVQTLELPSAPSSAATQLWFSQGVFSGLDDIDKPREDTDHKNEDDTSTQGNDRDKDEVCRPCHNLCIHFQFLQTQTQVSSNEDDFEIVPQNPDDDIDIDIWDVANEGEDKIKHEVPRKHSSLCNRSIF